MKVTNHIPHARIADYVQRIMVIEDCPVINTFTLPLFANGYPTLLFQTAKGTIQNIATSHLTLFGQTVYPDNLQLNNNFTLIAYFFKPVALVSLFGIGANELTNRPIDFHLWSNEKVSLLQEQLLNSASIEGMLYLLDSFIGKLIDAKTFNDAIIRYAANSIVERNSSKDSLTKVQKELNITERTFQRLFEKNIGISPNIYRRICQFNTAFEQLQKRNFMSLADLAYHNGYADQSHYIRAFKEFTNLTPREYLNFGTPP